MSARIIPAASVALLDGEKFLLVERGREPSRGLFAFPGGRLEPGEMAEEAARRELFEETGLVAGALILFQILDLRSEGDREERVFRLHVFTGAGGGDPVAADDAASVGWYAIEEMEHLPITPSTLAAAREILALRCAPPG